MLPEILDEVTEDCFFHLKNPLKGLRSLQLLRLNPELWSKFRWGHVTTADEAELASFLNAASEKVKATIKAAISGWKGYEKRKLNGSCLKQQLDPLSGFFGSWQKKEILLGRDLFEEVRDLSQKNMEEALKALKRINSLCDEIYAVSNLYDYFGENKKLYTVVAANCAMHPLEKLSFSLLEQLSSEFWERIDSSQMDSFELDAFVLSLVDGDQRLEAMKKNKEILEAKDLSFAAVRRIFGLEGLAEHLRFVSDPVKGVQIINTLTAEGKCGHLKNLRDYFKAGEPLYEQLEADCFHQIGKPFEKLESNEFKWLNPGVWHWVTEDQAKDIDVNEFQGFLEELKNEKPDQAGIIINVLRRNSSVYKKLEGVNMLIGKKLVGEEVWYEGVPDPREISLDALKEAVDKQNILFALSPLNCQPPKDTSSFYLACCYTFWPQFSHSRTTL